MSRAVVPIFNILPIVGAIYVLCNFSPLYSPPNERKEIEHKGIEFQRKQSLHRMLETNRW